MREAKRSRAQLTAVQAQRDTLLELKSGTADVAVIDAVMAYASVGEGTSYSDLVVVEGIEAPRKNTASASARAAISPPR